MIARLAQYVVATASLAGLATAAPAPRTSDNWLHVTGKLDWSRAEALDLQVRGDIAGVTFGDGAGGWLIWDTGRAIRARGLPTRVQPGATPTSALAMLWLAGADCRTVAPGAPCRTIGARGNACFHFPPRGWAAVPDTRAYLAEMGLSAGLVAELLDPGRTRVCPDYRRWRTEGVRVED